MLDDAALAKEFGERMFDRLTGDLGASDLELRNAVTAALGAMPNERSRKFLVDIVRNDNAATSHRLLALRLLFGRSDQQKPAQAVTDLKGKDAELLNAAAAHYATRTTKPGERVPLTVILKDGGKLADTSVRGLQGDKLLVEAAAAHEGLPKLMLPRGTVDEVRLGEAGDPSKGVRVLLKSGTRLVATSLKMDGDELSVEALGKTFKLDRSALRGLLPDPKKGRALGGSRKHDQLRLLEGDKKVLEGSVTSIDDQGVGFVDSAKKEHKLSWDKVQVLLFKLDSGSKSAGAVGDINQYVQVDLKGRERLVGFLLGLDNEGIALCSRSLGCIELPLDRVATMQLSNSGRALTGFTLVTDYGNTLIVEFDGEGREVWKLEDLFDPLDAELTSAGTILVTEQGDNAVREYDRDQKILWEFTDVSRPLDADRLPNGNTLITDPGNFRVIEVNPKGKIIWTFGRKEAKSPDFKPYDADRLANGNTLIADYSGQRVLEITPAGNVAWSYRGTKFVCDADRLANGNTLITMRQPPQVIEVNPARQVVWKIGKLQLPWDADRLPDGTTMVAENFGVKIYNRDGKLVKKLEAEWASESNGY